MPIYKVGDKKYDVPQEELEGFLAEFPQAEEFIEGKTTPTDQDMSVDATEVSEVTESTSEDGSLELEETKYKTPLTLEEKKSLQNNQFSKQMSKEDNFTKERLEELEEESLKEANVDSLGEYLVTSLDKGDKFVWESVMSAPGALFSAAALISDPINRALGLPETDVKKFEESIGTRPIIESLIEEQENLGSELDLYEKSKGIKGGAYENFKQGNASDGFVKLGRGLAESAPVSISMMMGGAAGASRLAMMAVATPVLAGPEIKTQREENPQQTELESVLKGFANAGAESFFEGIGSSSVGKVYKDIIFKEGKERGSKVFRNGLIEMYETAIKRFGVPATIVGGGIEEVATTMTQNLINEKPVFDNIGESFTQGVGGGGLYGAPVNISKSVEFVKDAVTGTKINSILSKSSDFELRDIQQAFEPIQPITEAQVEISKNKNSYKILDNKLKRSVLSGDVTNEQADAIRINFKQTQGTVNALSTLKLNTKDEANAVQLLKEKKQLKEQIKQVGEANLTIEQSDRIKEIDQDLKGIGSKAVTQEVEKVKKAAESIKDLDVQEFASTEETEAFLSEQGQDSKASGQQGFIIQNPKTGKQTIVINREVADREIAVAAPSHEFLHALLFSTVKNSPETQIALGNSLKEYINKIDVDKVVKDSDFAKRLEQYKLDPEAVQAEEVLTLFSDAIRTEDIKFNEDIFTKIGDAVRKALQALGVKVKFNNGKDVYNFIKDYNKSLESTGLTKAQIKVAEGVKGKLVADKVQTDEQIIKESRSTVLEAINELVPAEVKTKEEFQNPKVFNPIYKSLINEGGAINNYIRSRTTSVREAEKAIESVSDRLLNFDPEATRKAGETVGAEAFGEFIFANTNFGKMVAKKALFKEGEIAKQETPLDSPEATTQLADEVSIDETKVKSTTSKLRRVLGIKQDDAIYDLAKEVSGEILSGDLPGKKVKTAINKEARKSKLRKAVSDLMGTEKAIDEQFLNKNILEILKALPASDLVKLEREAKVKVLAEQGPRLNVKDAREAVNKGLLPKDTNLQSGPKVSSKLPTTLEQAKEFFTQKRKAGLVNVVTEMLVKDAAPEVTEGKMEPAKRAKVLSEIDRAPTLKFSRSAGSQSNVNANVEKQGENVIKPGKDGVADFTEFLSGSLTTVFGKNANLFIKPSNLAGAGNSFISTRKTGGAKGRGFLFINDINRTNRFIKETKEALKKGEIGEIRALINTVNALENLKAIPESDLKAIKQAISNQTIKNIDGNLNNRDLHKKGVSSIINKFADLYNLDKKNIRGLAALIYHQNANSSFGRKMAPVLGLEEGVKPGSKSWEEHVYQFGNFANRTLQAVTSKDKKIIDGWIDWVNDNYYQEVTGKDTQGIVDSNYETNRFNGKALEKWKAKSEEHPYLFEKLNEAFKTGDFSNVPPADIRKYNEYFTLNPNNRSIDGTSDATKYNVEVPKKLQNITEVYEKQGELIYKQFISEITAEQAQSQINKFVEVALSIVKASKSNNDKSAFKFSKAPTNKVTIDTAAKTDEALNIARDLDAPIKKIRVFDFDDTLAQTKSDVLYTMPDGTEGKLNAEQFANDGSTLLSEGAVFDFSEFNKVTEGKKGPLFKVAQTIAAKRGTEDVFVLTARAPESQLAIYEFLKSQGLNIPLKNITGLGNSTGDAKARWIVDKAADGYNDFYFADDAPQNVKAVKDALSVIDVKSKTQQAKIKFSKSLDLNKDFNDIIENKTGIASDKTYARVKAEVAGANKGKFNFFIPPSAEDFVGLLYSTLAKGSTGDAQMAWYKAHLLNPFARAMENLANDRANMMQDFRGLKKALKIVPKNLRKKIKDSNFTQEQAVRAYIWDKQGMEIPGLSNKDQKDLVNFVNADANLTVFADQLIAINKGDEYAAPDAGWVAGTIGTDFIKALNTTKRSKYLEVWNQNVDQIFSEANLNKLEAAYGANYKEAMVDMLKRMETGRNTSSGSDRLAGRFTDWLTNSVGAIMFFNTRSAVLQTISAVNFINFSDNNVLKAGQAFANQPQYWKDFKKLFNSPFLLDRRSGLKLNVNEADIADMAKGPGNSARNVIAGILKAGFLPTQLADSFAIASGGASFYRNRIKALQKEGLTETEAEEVAFRDFREIAEESQQSSRPDKISQQQAGPLGRVVLAFANTPAQYARLIKKAASDLKNGRGDAKTNISKIIYYGVAQNVLFSALQQALFAISFGDEDEEEEKRNEKYFNIANGMSDSILRGIGVGGAIASVVKNTAIKLAKEEKKKSPKYQDVLVKEVLQISPPISSKVGKLRSAGRSLSWNKKEMMTKGWAIDNPAYLASANVISAVTNIPADRAIKKITNIVDASNEETEYYKRIALALGWSSWELGIDKKDKKKPESSTGKSRTRKRSRKRKKRN